MAFCGAGLARTPNTARLFHPKLLAWCRPASPAAQVVSSPTRFSVPPCFGGEISTSYAEASSFLFEIHARHALPPGPVVAGLVAPDVQTMGDVFGSHDLCQSLIFVPAHVVFAGGEHVLVLAIAVEVPGV